ncbi:MAG: hypothetical protein ABSD62_12695 [Candidatus Limnocylindrales bacterium]|jgi:hypothetical protein
MAYTALPDMRIPYDNDGSAVGWSSSGNSSGNGNPCNFGAGVTSWMSGSEMSEMNDEDATAGALPLMGSVGIGSRQASTQVWWFFPERRTVTGLSILVNGGGGMAGTFGTSSGIRTDLSLLQGSNDSANGVDGTWESASIPGGWQSVIAPLNDLAYAGSRFEAWRAVIGAISFTGGKATVRAGVKAECSITQNLQIVGLHLYGEKVAGQTPDDVIYINHDDTPGAEYAAPEDFGDQPLGTTVVRQFRLKNTSATRTANSITVQCNDADFAISSDGTTWVVTINIASLGPGAQSATMYVRCTTPAPGNLLGPRFARIVTTVSSYT